MDAQDGVWNWEGGETLALLDGSEPCVLDCVFDNAKWGDRPRFCPFTVCNRQKSESVFLELHVVEGTKNAAHYGRWQEKGRPKAIVRKPFCVFSDESLTMGFSHEGEFFLVDEEDVVRCLITAGELRSAVKSGAPRRVGFISVDPEVSIRLGSIKGVRSSFLSDRKVVMPSSSLFTPTIQLKWNAFDESRVSVSENRRTASCCSTFGGQAVLGTPLPSTGVSAFLIYWDRSGASSGVSLGSGHFTGVAVEGFSDTAPLYSDMKNLTGTVWAVQDLTDGDSMTNQLFIPPTEEGSRVVYGTGTKLLFILDRSACTLSLARDNESPRVVFKDIPKDVVLCPFVRIDNTASFATLASFSQQYNELYHPPSANSLASQPLTASWVRRFPLVQVSNRFPILRYILGALPLSKAAAFEACWGDLDIKTRFDYHVKKAVEALVELGCLTAEADVDLFLQEDAFRRILSALQSPVAESHIIFAHHHVEYTFELDRAYEVVHLVPEHGMAQLLYFDPQTATCTESTFIMVASSEVNVDALCSSSLVPHFMVVTEQRLLRPLFAATDDVCGFVVDGWYNSRLSCRDVSTLSESDTRKIALSLVYGLEHWHLHGVAHTGVCAANLLLSVDRDEVVKCVLWNGVLSAPPMLGVCDSVFREDLCGCVRVLESLPLLPGIEASSEKFLQYLQNGEFSLTEALRETDLFLDRRVESDESPATVFRTGAKLRGGSGSYNGIMFDLVAKENPLRILKLSFLPDITTTAVVSVFTRDGGFMGVEEKRSCWRKVFEKPLSLYDNTEVVVEDFTEQICIAAGSRTGIFLHTTSGSGVLYYSRSEGVRAEMGHVEESNGDIGITVGKKSESNQPFVAIQNQERLLKGSVTYALIKRSNGPRSSLLYSADERRLKETVKERRMSWAPPQPVRIHGGLEGFRTLSLDEKDLILRENGGMEWFSKASVHDMILRDGDDLVGALDSLLQKMRLELDASQVSGWQYEKLPFRAVGEAGGESRFASDSLSPCDQIISITTHGQAVMRVCLFTEGNEECMDWIECKNSLFLLFDAGSLVLLLDDRRPLCEFNVSDHAYHLVIASPGSTKMGSFVAYRATRAAVTGVRLSDHEAVICDLSDQTVRVHLWCVTVEALSDGDGRSVQCRLSFPVSFQIQMDATFTNAEGAPESVSYLLEEHGEDHLVVEFKVCKAKPLFLRIRPVLPVAHPTLTFAAPTQGVKVVSDRVSQVAHFNGEPLKCMVCTPRLCSREAHSIKLLLWFPPKSPHRHLPHHAIVIVGESGVRQDALLTRPVAVTQRPGVLVADCTRGSDEWNRVRPV
ncbi:hypothetical protein, conserved [Angomonas deanei]|uniref:Uncharacterized protein n=1 Tax=Angomonas deanei TaxID=59799 RepID=A0A7G2CNZ4_9TRYP|nr:hypothetical protein, conserved [Angomonas deanei]